MNNWNARRRAGVLLHPTSLPSPGPTGTLGVEAFQFIDALAESGFTVWQFLPLGPTHGHGSPYESLSSLAGNPNLLDLCECVEQGWLKQGDFEQFTHGKIAPDAARALAAKGFWKACQSDHNLTAAIAAFQQANRDWLDDYALFAALKKATADKPWWKWKTALRDRDPTALAQAGKSELETVQQTLFEQYLFSLQWEHLKTHAEARGVLLFGDLPIYVAHDSCDVWTNRHYFTVNDAGQCDEVAGVPPDYFSDTGQRWGNPLYRWDVLEKTGFNWWVERVRIQFTRMHIMRIDHFRGLEAYWAIPGKRSDGMIGEWRKAPGGKLLAALKSELGELPLVAEDLGLITPEVHALRQQFGLPGMKILQFAFGGDAHNPYLPHNHEVDMVAYTGTHDNDTSMGWLAHAPKHVIKHMKEYLGQPVEPQPWPLIRACLASVACLSVLPMQDLLQLGHEARFNTPGTLKGNWQWRMHEHAFTQNLRERMQTLSRLYGR